MVFGTRYRLGARDTADLNINLDGKPVKYTEIFKYLGVVLANTLSFNDHTLYIRKKISKILGILSRIRPFLTLEAANKVYKTMVLPVLDYCDIVCNECGQGNNDDIERLQRRGSRIVHHKAALGQSTDDILINLGWDSLHSRRESHVYDLMKNRFNDNI